MLSEESSIAQDLGTMLSWLLSKGPSAGLQRQHERDLVALTENTYNGIVLIRTAITFAMLQDGIPIIYQGQEQEFTGADTPANRAPLWTSNYNKTANLYLHIQNVNELRTWAIQKDATWLTYNAYPIYNDTQTVVMRKGYDGKQIIGVYSNSGSNGAMRTITVASTKSGFTAGQKITEGLRCQALTADSKGNLGVVISGGSASVLYPTAGLAGSGICGL